MASYKAIPVDSSLSTPSSQIHSRSPRNANTPSYAVSVEQKQSQNSPTKRRLSCGRSHQLLSRYHDFLYGDHDALPQRQAERVGIHIKSCAQCRHYLNHIDRLFTQISDITDKTIATFEADTTWLDDILSALTLDIRRGKLLPIKPLYSTDTLGIYEGAVRAITRRIGSSGPIVIARSKVEYSNGPNSGIRVDLDAYAAYPCHIMRCGEKARQRVLCELSRIDGFTVDEVNLVVTDVFIVESTTQSS